MKLEEEIYLQSVASRWENELKTSEDVYILSPSLTLEMVKEVVQNGPKYNKSDLYNYYGIYTLLSFENFLTDRSSIEAIKYLIENDYDVFSLPELSANIVLIPDVFVSIGSHGLAVLKSENKEATFTSTDPEIIRYVENEIKENWLKKDCKRITLEMLEDIEESLRHVKEDYKQIKTDLEKAQEVVAKKKKQREEEKKEKESKHRERLEKLQENIEILEKTLTVKGNVKKVKDLYTFIPTNDLLKRKIEDNKVDLHSTHRYLAIVENTGKLGWARIVKTRITQYHDNFKLHIPLKFGENEYSVAFKANWDEKVLSDYNLEIKLSHENYPRLICKVFVWFNLNDLEIIDIKITSQNPDMENFFEDLFPPISYDEFRNIKGWIEKNVEIFKKSILLHLLMPFKYEKNLVGEEAMGFLGYEKKCELKIGSFQNHNILVFKVINHYKNYAIFI